MCVNIDNEYINKYIPADAMIIYNVLKNKGFKVYFVGGALRDIVYSQMYNENIKIKDWDIVSNATYDDMFKLFNKQLRVRQNGRFVNKVGRVELLIPSLGTTGVKLGGAMYEITPFNEFNGETYEATSDEVKDFSKRDFTINTFRYSLDSGLEGEFVTSSGMPVNAMDDLDRGIIRSVGDPKESFGRNYYNMFRAILFANRFNFAIDDETLSAIRLCSMGITNVNKGKLAVGFESLLSKGKFEKIEYLFDTGLVSSLCDEWTEDLSIELTDMLRNMSGSDLGYVDKLDYIYKCFSDKDMILTLYKSFGVNKDILFKIENGYVKTMC